MSVNSQAKYFWGWLLFVEILNLTDLHTAAQLGSTSLSRAYTYGWVHGHVRADNTSPIRPIAVLCKPPISWVPEFTFLLDREWSERGVRRNHWSSVGACFVWQVPGWTCCGLWQQCTQAELSCACSCKEAATDRAVVSDKLKDFAERFSVWKWSFRFSLRQFESKTHSHLKVQLPCMYNLVPTNQDSWCWYCPYIWQWSTFVVNGKWGGWENKQLKKRKKQIGVFNQAGEVNRDALGWNSSQ